MEDETLAHRILCVFGIATLFIQAQNTVAVEVLSARELATHCEAIPNVSDSADGQYCIRYIQGFVDGAVATDARVMINLDAEYARSETFTERAMRTRTPSRSVYERAAGYAEFCLGDPVSLREVVDKVVTDLNDRKHLAPEITARDVVYSSLRKHYPCKKPVAQK